MRKFPTLVEFLTSKSSNITTDSTAEFEGYDTIGVGASKWKHNGITGQTPSQSPAQLGDALFNDGSGDQWGLLFKSEINIAQLGGGFDVTNDVSPANAALSALDAIGGGNLIIDLNTKVIFATNLDIPANCAIVGGHLYLDTTDRDKWPTMGSRIRLAATATIGTQNGSGLRGMLVYRDDMTFPAAGLTAAEVSLYAGTAITVKSAAPYIGYCTFLGFNLAITTAATNTPRGRLEYNNIDCLSGVKVDLDLGAWTIAYNYCQPILSNSDADNIRTGIGFELINKSDWTTLIGNFAFQDIGYRITDSNQIKLIGCGADHPTDGTDLYNTGVAFEIKGDSQDNYLIGCQGASHKSGLQVLTDSGTRNYVSDSHFWNMASDGFGYEILGGEVGISGGSIRGFISNGGKGVFVNNANAKVSLSAGLRMKNIAVGMDTPVFDEFLVAQDLSFDNVPTIRSNESIKQVASSGNVTPLQNEAIQEITGVTTVGTFIGAGVMPQKIITFIINDGLTINNGNTLLNGAVNWVAPAGSSITLQYITGNTWREISRNEQ